MEFVLDFPSQLILKGENYTVMKYGVSEEEFWKISNEDSNFELIDGVLIIHSPASTEHEEIFGYLHTLLRIYLEKTQLGKVFGSRLVMRLNTNWNPEPDLMVILSKNYDRIKSTMIDGPADLVIEILSPSTREIDLTKKLPQYRKAGIKETWIIDPAAKSITIFQIDSESHYPYANKKELDNGNNNTKEWIQSTVLPSLKISSKWIWNRERFPIHEIISQIN